MTLTEENYIKTIYHLAHQGDNNVSTNDIAKEVNAKASSVTDMIKKLSDKDYVAYQKYRGVSLTDKGIKIALSIIRKHRLWEVFLLEKLNFSWDEVHEVAEQLEHIKSEKLTEQLNIFLGYPTHDPHGDPIPDEHGNIKKIDKILLSQAKIGSRYICVGVNDSSSDFLKYLDRNAIALGSVIDIISKESFDKSMQVKINHQLFSLSQYISNNLFVKVYRS